MQWQLKVKEVCNRFMSILRSILSFSFIRLTCRKTDRRTCDGSKFAWHDIAKSEPKSVGYLLITFPLAVIRKKNEILKHFSMTFFKSTTSMGASKSPYSIQHKHFNASNKLPEYSVAPNEKHMNLMGPQNWVKRITHVLRRYIVQSASELRKIIQTQQKHEHKKTLNKSKI